jgi:UDP-N-acetylmuramoylalanine--D-glutamate ligase
LKGKYMKVAIAGYGIEGEANYRYWVDLGHDVTIVDENTIPAKPIPENAKVLLGEKVFRKLQDFDLVVRTASLPPQYIKTDGDVWSSTNEFFAECPAPIIGVTGTKGKGTTSSLITNILRAAGHTVHLVGNIGTPSLSVLPEVTKDDIVVFELSSFQLWDLKLSPHVAVVLMIEPDHLDIHADFDDYIKAKSNIRRHQKAGDICFYHPTNEHSAKIAKSAVLGDIERYAHEEGHTAYVKDGYFYVHGDKICPTSVMSIQGAHNIENACAAISAARVFTVDNVAIERGLHEFEGLPHRLKFVREVHGVQYFDDSIATTGGSVIAAIHAFTQPKVLVLVAQTKVVTIQNSHRKLPKAHRSEA